MENMDNFESEDLDLEGQDTEQEKVDKELYEKALAEAEKYKGYFKKAKSKQQKQSIDSSLKDEIMAELRFYTTTPQAEQYKEQIDEYREKGLSYDDAFRLVASKDNPQLLLDQQSQAQNNAPSKVLDGVSSDLGTDYSTWKDDNIKKASDDEFNKYWDNMKLKK